MIAVLKGAFGVLLTPFTADGHVDYDAYEKELDFVSKRTLPAFSRAEQQENL